MRDIKFRIYDKFNDCYWYSHKYESLLRFFEVIQSLKEGNNTFGNLQQFVDTENDKDIYEGDIVKRTKKTLNQEKVMVHEKDPYDYTEEISFIEYSGRGFYVKGEDFGWEGEDLWDWEQMEVIGTIDQNPDLLK